MDAIRLNLRRFCGTNILNANNNFLLFDEVSHISSKTNNANIKIELLKLYDYEKYISNYFLK